MTTAPDSYAADALPRVVLKPKAHKRAVLGHPWVYANEIEMDAGTKALAPGSVARLMKASGEPLALAFFNPKPLITARVLTRDCEETVDAAFWARRLERALQLRERLFDQPFYRLVHAEADAMPGLIIDRFDDTLAVQINTAGFERQLPALSAAMDEVLKPRSVVLRADSPARSLEGLEPRQEVLRGQLEEPTTLMENGVRFIADLGGGQKTGWFFDQRDNRAWIAGLARGRRVLDCYAYTGGFAVTAAVGGAEAVTAVDRSEPALKALAEAAVLNGVAERVQACRAEVFADLARRGEAGERYGIVVVDPPAFVKSKKDISQGLRGYRKLVRLASQLVEPGGILFAASCSHHVDAQAFSEQVRRGLSDVGREGKIIKRSGPGCDHPVHPHLPESAYLKAETLVLD